MVNPVLIINFLLPLVHAIPQSKGTAPKSSGSNGILSGLLSSVIGGINPMPGGQYTPNSFILWDPENPGSGPYAAKAYNDPTLPKHTIYAPISPPKKKLPLIVWGNGGCIAVGTMFSGFLKEIASHGFIVVSNGNYTELPSIPEGELKGDYKKNPLLALFNSAPPGATSAIPKFLGAGMTSYTWQIQSIDWAAKGAGGGKYGEPDMAKIAVAGQSCGGQEAYSVTAKDSRIKATALFNSGTLSGSRDPLKSFKNPVGIFNGGPTDLAYNNGEKDYDSFASTLPVVKANIDSGHLGTFFAKNGGTYGKIAVAFFKAALENDMTAKSQFSENGPFQKDGWNIKTKNWS